jgi:hypothetical protein
MIGEHLCYVTDNVEAVNVEDSGPWAAEEHPGVVTEELLRFASAAN